MDLEERVDQLARQHDWPGVLTVLEQGLQAAGDATAKAGLHLQLGRLLHGQFLQGVRALKHFQDAYKLNPSLLEALSEARQIYWELGKLNMVQKLLKLELKAGGDAAKVSALHRNMGDVLCDQGDYDGAAKAYAAAQDGDATGEVKGLLGDVRIEASAWQENIGELLRAAHGADTAEAKGALFLRAARIAQRFAPEEAEGILTQAYQSDPMSVSIAAVYEGLLVEQNRTEGIVQVQDDLLKGIEDGETRAAVAFCFGCRWALRHQNPEMAKRFLEIALRMNPSLEPAFSYLREIHGAAGDWDYITALANELSDRPGAGEGSSYLLASAGLIAWREQGDLIKARKFFERLAQGSPKHPAVVPFEKQIGESLSGGAQPASAPTPAPPAVAAEPEPEPEPEAEAEPEPEPEREPVASSAGTAPPQEQDDAVVRDLEEKLAQVEKRPHEYVKTLVALADALVDPAEKVSRLREAADLYANKSSNQAEAVRTYEKLIEIEPDDPDASAYLVELYEKRRDWEKLIAFRQRDADRLEPGPERTAAYREIAELATERVKKPEVCIELWAVVLDNDAEDEAALSALSQLYERSRDYEKLADVLEKLAQFTFDEKEKINVLTKLGQVAGDRLKDDERAAEAYRMLLVLQPDDRRAQEQLKKRYVSLGRWDDLEVFYADTGKWDEFIRVLESNESRAADTEQRISMLMKVAELWMTQKGKPDRAARAYEKVLALDEANLPAAERLIPIYQQGNNPKGLCGAIEVKLANVDDLAERLELLREVAGLYETRLNDKAVAFERYLAAFQIDPGDEQAQVDLERIAQATSTWAQVVAAYREAGKSLEASDVHLANALRLRLGRILVEEVGNIDEALAEYGAVHESEPDNELALQALEQLYRQTERWKDLLAVYERRRDLILEAELRKPILFEIAKLYEEQIGEPEAAIETYAAILEDDADEVAALVALDRLYLGTKAWPAYAEVLRRRIELDVNESELIDLKHRLARTLGEHLDDAAGALENYREILFLDADHEGARLALEGMLEGPQGAEAASILEAIYEQREDWDRLIQALEILAQTTEEPDRAVELLRKIAATAAMRLGAPERALAAQARAVKADPALMDSRLELEQLAEQAGAWDQLIEIYSDVASDLDDAALARDYWMRLAAIEERLGKVAEAATSYEKVLALDPADTEALAAMDALYRGNEQWEKLVGVFRRRIELSQEPGESEALYGQMAQVYEEHLGRPEEAILAYREVLTLDPQSRVALDALEGLLTRQEAWDDLAENLEVKLSLAESDNDELQLMLRLAGLREQKMAQPDAAIEGYRQILERDPANSVALAALERLSDVPEHALTIAEILEPLYRTQGDYQKLVGVHEVQVRQSEDPARKVELLHRIAELYEDAAGDLNASFDTFARALGFEPANELTQAGLDRLARATGRFTDLAGVYEQRASSEDDPELASILYTSAARVFESDVADSERAIELYRKVLTIDPTNLDAAEALQALFQASERYQDMSLILQRKAEILDDIDQQKAALYQAALLEEEVLERRESAIGVYLKVLELDPEDLRSIDALINLYLALSRWEELLGVYSKKADLVYDTTEKKLILYQVGAVHERELNDVSRAIDTYQRVLELDPDDLSALGRLDVLYQTAENWQELLSVLTHEAELTQDPAEAVSYQYRIAELYEKHLEDIERAVELYRDILQIQPDHAPTLQALEGITAGRAAPLAAAGVLEPVYESIGEWQKLVSVLEVQVRFTEDDYAKVDLLHRIARLYEESLGDHQNAFATYARAVGFDSQNEESLGSLERLAMMIERWRDVAHLYDAELDKLEESPEELVELGLRVAQVYEVQLEAADSAVERYRRVLAADPENRTATRSLDRLFTQAERWQDLAEILVKESEIGESPDEILEFKYRLGQVYEHQLRDVDQAIDAYREVINAAPEHELALNALENLFAQGTKQLAIGEILEPLYQSTAEWEKLIAVREAQLQHIEELDERMSMYQRIAEDAEERLMDPVLAFNVFVRALKENPVDEQVGEELERLAAMLDGGWELLANAYADALGIEGMEPATQASIGKRLARVFEEELADVAKAEETYRYVLTMAPAEPEALANLDRIYSSLEQWTDLAGVLEQRAATAEDEHDKIDFYVKLGAVYEEQLGQIPDAIRAYRVIFDGLGPSNEEALIALGRIYEQTEQWQELRAVYERELENAAGDVQEAEIRAKAAHLAAERLDDVPGAIEGWKRVLDLRGEDPEALWALAGLYETQGQWAELTDVLERHFDIADTDEERVNVLTRRARLFSEQLGRDDEALETWQRVLDIDFSNVQSLNAIAQIWRSRQDAHELVNALHATIDRAAALLEPPALVAVYRELGKTYGSVLEQPFEASEAWRNLLEVDPADFEAMEHLERIYRDDERWVDVIGVKRQRAAALEEVSEKVRELLEVTELWKSQVGEADQATADFEKILEADPAHDEAFESVEKLHKAAERWEPLIELYLNRLETREEVSDRSVLLRRIARVFEEKLDDINQAFDALVNAFAEDYNDDETNSYLERLAQQTNRWAELIQSAQAWLGEEEETKKKIQLCLRLGKWYGEDLGHPEHAQHYYQQIHAMDPNNVQVMRQMAAIHRLGGQWEKVGGMLTRALEVAVSNEDRKAILHDLGELLERNMDQVDQGVAYYKRALEADPYYLPTLNALERIYEARSDHAELASVLGSKVRALEDADETTNAKLRMAGLYENELGDLQRAAQVYREVLGIDDTNLAALRGLERVDTALQDWPDLVQILGRQLDVVETERDRIEVLLKLGNLQEEQFLKAEVAAQRFEQALEIDPTEERAYVALARCYRRLKQWLDLVSTYERHINEAAEHATKLELFAAIAQVFQDEVGDVDRAIEAYQNIVDLDDTNVAALEALSRLYEKQDDPARAIEAMTRVADLTVDGQQRVEMYFRIGRSLEEKLGDRGGAQERFEMALDLDPTHLPTLAALRTIAVDEADWDRAARYLEQEQANTELPRQRAKLLVELGKLRDEMLGEHELAIQAYELAIQSDDDCEEAALPLVEEYVKVEEWPKAEPLAEMLVKKSKNRERHEQHTLHKLHGKVLAAQAKYEDALKAYQKANQLDLTDQETVRGIADVAFELKDWPSALTNYQKVLSALGEDDVEQRTDVYYRLGRIKQEQGQGRQAINNYEKALALNGEHRQTLDALIEVYAASNDWKQVAAYQRQVLDSVFDGDERYKILVEIGDLWTEKDDNAHKAIEALEEALELKPSDHVLLHKLLQLYQKAQEWQKMVDTLQAISAMEERPQIKARYTFTQAQVYRDKLEDLDRAVELFNEALDLNPDYLEAFERINKVLTQQRGWKQLERSYRKMLHRVTAKGKPDLEYTLWHQLGLIYRDRMERMDDAIEAFKMAAQVKPESVVEHQILGELYEASERWDEAIAQQRVILDHDVLNADCYRTLYRLYLHKQTYDEAWLMAAAMAFMKKAEGEELQFFEDYRPKEMLKPKGRLTNELWNRCVTHANQSVHISNIFAAIEEAVLNARVAQLRATGKLPQPPEQFRQDPNNSTITFTKTFVWAAHVLGIGMPSLYVRNDQDGAILTLPTLPKSSIAGRTVLSGFTPQELAFICGKHLASYRPEHYIRCLFPTQAELTNLLFAGVMLVAPQQPMPPEMATTIRTTAQSLAQYMQPVRMEQLRAAVKQFLADGAKANIKRWNQSAELSSCRAGLALCGDLDIAKRIILAEQQMPGDLSPQEKMKDLLRYSVSPEYAALRQALGVTIGV